MSSISIVHNDPAFVTCKRCGGNGWEPSLADHCSACDGHGEVALDLSDLATLAHNLAMAGALMRSFHLGADTAISERNLGDAYEADMLSMEQYKAGFAKIWDPGCGRRAP